MFLGKLLSLPIDKFDVTGRPEHCLQYRKIQFERRSRIEVVQLGGQDLSGPGPGLGRFAELVWRLQSR